mmetsp:Transcript_12101/g.33501  ORF Transcript_12101/g.33501 Transcript_12101/m.33501 type:complete len:293 (-) Transcript_12101:1383-2261(-)
MGTLFSSFSPWEASSRTVLITGASSGIGAELARQFAKENTHLALLGRNEERLTSVATECRELGAASVKTYSADLSENYQIDRAVRDVIQDFGGGFDVVVLNAGRSQGCYFEEILDAEQIDYLLKLNVSGNIILLQKILRHVYKSRHSRIVFVSSTAGIIPVAYRTIYCASKFAITGFSGSLRMELKDTYGEDAPKVCLLALPEVGGTNLNQARLQFGANQPPVQFKEEASAGLKSTCEQAMSAIRRGDREWGLPTKVSLLRPFYSLLPNTMDNLVMKHLRKTHFRPTSDVNK